MTRPLVMGIVNVTPDSFSGDGLLSRTDYCEQATAQARQMIADGADILDIRGESSRPGSVPVTTEEELRRVVPVIAAIRQFSGELPLSVDTIKAAVADAALEAGATIINDITALQGDPHMLGVAISHAATVVLMHNRATAEASTQDPALGGHYHAPAYKDVCAEVEQNLKALAKRAIAAGVARDKIILDPGIGFGKTREQNLALIMHVDKLKSAGFPVLMGVSRKSFIGQSLDLPVDQRLKEPPPA